MTTATELTNILRRDEQQEGTIVRGLSWDEIGTAGTFALSFSLKD
jgi:hypothetical protein